MSEITTTFKAAYVAGETAKLAVSAPGAASVSVVFGASSLVLRSEADGKWTGSVPTDGLVGGVPWTVFEKSTDGSVTAIGHGSFNVLCAGRSSLREVIAAIDEAIKTWGTNPNRSIAVGEINVTYKSLDELLAIRAQYVQQAETQETGRSLTGGLRVMEVRF